MKLTEGLKQRTARLLTAPGDELSSWARMLRFQIQLWGFCAKRLREHNALAMSSALSFRTIFALVPILVLGFLLLKSVGVDTKQFLWDFTRESGLSEIVYEPREREGEPTDESTETSGPGRVSLTDHLESLIEDVEGQLTLGRMGPIGVLLLVWTALTLLTTMERSLNRVFEAPKSRSLGRRILLYWSAVTLGPLVLFTAGYLGRRAMGTGRTVPFISWAIASVGWAGPIVVGVVLLGLLYKVMPNTHVRFRSAISGAVVAAPVWLLARWAFSLYVQHVGKQSFYGAMGLIPLFLMWLNLSWWIFLFGAALAHSTATVVRGVSAGRLEDRFFGPWDLLGTVVAIARASVMNPGPVHIASASVALGLSEQSTEELLSRLIAAKLVVRVADDEANEYLLAKSPERMLVSEVLQIAALGGPDTPSRRCAAEVVRAVSQVRKKSESALQNMTVAEIIGV